MEKKKNYLAYVLVDPNTNIPRYVGITTTSLSQRFAGHMRDIYNRPNLNPHKTNWFKKLLQGGQIPKIELIKECDSLEELKQFEVDYIKKYKKDYKLINMTSGGDWVGEHAHDRETILKRRHTRAVTQYNILGEKIADYEIMEDIMRELGLKEKACSHITQCCKGTRKYAYGYVWRYKGDPLGDISNINPRSLDLNYLVQYSLNGERIAEFDSAKLAAEAVGKKSSSNLSSVIKGNQKTFGGYLWQIEPKFVYFDQKLFEEIHKNTNKNTNLIHNNYIIQCFDLENNLISEFRSMLDAAQKMYNKEYYRKHIDDCCKGIKEQWKGYKWKKVSINPSNSENELIESTQS